MNKNIRVLNNEQKLAVEHFEGPCMVLAGPGTGKTTIIINRVLHLIKNHKIEPEKILVVTFTKAAANEMTMRFYKSSESIKGYKQVTFSTFHAIFFKILQSYKNYKIENLINEKEKNTIVKSIINSLKKNILFDEQYFDELLNELSYVKNTLADSKEYTPKQLDNKTFWEIYERYESYKVTNEKFDFDDMVNNCYELLLSNKAVLKDLRLKFKYILIDEFQDINIPQFRTITLLAEPLNNLFIVGDDDQSIYKFRGSNPEIMRDFSRLFTNARIITLKNNYRNSSIILSLATSLININNNRYKKELKSTKGMGNIPSIIRVEDYEQEAEKITAKIKSLLKNKENNETLAVLYRTRAQSGTMIDSFIRNNIHFICYEGFSYIHNHWIMLDVISYLKASQNIDRNNSIYRIINKPYRDIGRALLINSDYKKVDILDSLLKNKEIKKSCYYKIKVLEDSLNKLNTMGAGKAVDYIIDSLGYKEYLREYAFSNKLNEKPFYEILNEIKSISRNFISVPEFLKHMDMIIGKNFRKSAVKNCVKLMTMHKAKGLEFDVVFIIGVNDDINELKEKTDIENIEEERRLFYVAMTRAKEDLYFSVPKYRFGKRVNQSRHLDEIYI